MVVYTVEQIRAIKREALDAAANVAAELEKELDAKSFYGSCGFAWLSILNIKGNTKLGRNMKAAGIPRAYDGSLQIWNPSGSASQSIDVKEAGAYAAAIIFKKYGFQAHADSRLD